MGDHGCLTYVTPAVTIRPGKSVCKSVVRNGVSTVDKNSRSEMNIVLSPGDNSNLAGPRPCFGCRFVDEPWRIKPPFRCDFMLLATSCLEKPHSQKDERRLVLGLFVFSLYLLVLFLRYTLMRAPGLFARHASGYSRRANLLACVPCRVAAGPPGRVLAVPRVRLQPRVRPRCCVRRVEDGLSNLYFNSQSPFFPRYQGIIHT